MTIEDRIQASLVHHADSVPELHGLGPLVVARARTVRRRRRTGAAAGVAAVAAGALAVVLHGTGPHHDGPAHPSPTPSPSPVRTAAPASSFAPQSTPPPFRLDLPTGPALSQPALLMTNKVQLSVVRAGVEHQLGLLTAGVTGSVVNAGAGIVFQSGDSVDLVSPSNVLSQLVDEPGLRGFAVSRDGHYLAWGRAVTGGSGALTGELGLYDLQMSRSVSTLVLPEPGTPTGFLGDARVAVDTDDGTHLGALLWTPAGGGVVRLPSKATGVDPLSEKLSSRRQGGPRPLCDVPARHRQPAADARARVSRPPSVQPGRHAIRRPGQRHPGHRRPGQRSRGRQPRDGVHR